ncbi:MAG TPA: ABC transporter permease [Nocardioidaceae bacterium]|nr:ABC transporter permease [Nocardioidaceae bacterium]
MTAISTEKNAKAPPTYLVHDKSLFRRVWLRPEAVLSSSIVLIVVLSMLLVPNYLRPSADYTFSTLLLNAIPILFLLLPVTLIIATGDIDLSVSSVLGLSSAVFGLGYQAGIPIWLAALLGVIVGGGVGIVNGVLVTIIGLPSLAVTIGTLALFRGIAVGLLGTTAITNFPPPLTKFFSGSIPGTPIPWQVLFWLAPVIAFAVLLHFTPFGRGIFAIGRSSEMATFSGVNVVRTRLILFVLSGLVAGAVGVFFTLQYSNAIGSNGSGFELQVVTAIVLGGVSIWGGRGTLLGAIAGGLFIASFSKSLQILGVGDDAIYVITGSALIISVVVSSISGRVSIRRRRKGSPTPAGGE